MDYIVLMRFGPYIRMVRERPQLVTGAIRALANLPKATVRRLLADANDAAQATGNKSDLN